MHSGLFVNRGAGAVRAGEGVVVFPDTPICQLFDRWGRVLCRGGFLSRKRHAIQSKGMFELCGADICVLLTP